jgi:inward rectifier potassium channel
MNQDGSFNIARKGMRGGISHDLYHTLLSVSWPKFLGGIAAYYVMVNALFGTLFALCGEGALEGARRGSFCVRWVDSFFFSVQTLATIGYGKITPVGLPANLLVTLEALIGMLGVALATGLLFARFSRPTARVIFSHRAMISVHDGVPSLVFRMANARMNQIVEARLTVVLAISEVTAEGERYRNFYNLALERSESPMFALSWTVVHPIDAKSPLHGLSAEKLREAEAEVLISLIGTDETFSQSIHARHSYIPSEIIWGGFYEDMLKRNEQRLIEIDLARIHEYRMNP